MIEYMSCILKEREQQNLMETKAKEADSAKEGRKHNNDFVKLNKINFIHSYFVVNLIKSNNPYSRVSPV